MNYSKKVMDNFAHPQNVGRIVDADGMGKVGNLRCGDVMRLYIKVEGDRLRDVKFETYGCAAAIASSSVITQMAKGKKIDEVKKMTKDGVLKELGGLPPVKVHCSLLAIDALKAAIKDWENGPEAHKEIQESLR